MHATSSWTLAFVTALIAVSLSDVAYRRVSNALALTVGLMGCTYWSVFGGLPGLRFALLGGLAGGALILPLYIVHWVGAADVKVFAGFATWLGAALALHAALLGLLAGGALSLAMLWDARPRRRGAWGAARVQDALASALHRARQRELTIPLAAALAFGVLLAGTGEL